MENLNQNIPINANTACCTQCLSRKTHTPDPKNSNKSFVHFGAPLEDTGIDSLLGYNKRWAKQINDADPSFFKNLSQEQNPEYLWIGCSDSRVPVEALVGLGPGQVFVHRNVGNQVIHTDLNCLSVIQYAVDVLKVKHIIICGHYQCGGVQAAIENPKLGLINNWLLHIRDIYQRYKKELLAIENNDIMFDKLVELNIVQQVYNIGNSTILQAAWERGQEITIHAWIYGLKDGLVKEIDYAANSKQVFEEVHDRVFAKLLSQINGSAKSNQSKTQPILNDHAEIDYFAHIEKTNNSNTFPQISENLFSTLVNSS